MTLKQIELRMVLFPDYLRYRINNWERSGRLRLLRALNVPKLIKPFNQT